MGWWRPTRIICVDFPPTANETASTPPIVGYVGAVVEKHEICRSQYLIRIFRN
jgi:hypothetical protein